MHTVAFSEEAVHVSVEGDVEYHSWIFDIFFSASIVRTTNVSMALSYHVVCQTTAYSV